MYVPFSFLFFTTPQLLSQGRGAKTMIYIYLPPSPPGEGAGDEVLSCLHKHPAPPDLPEPLGFFIKR